MRALQSVLPLALGLLTTIPVSPLAAQDTVPRFEATPCPFETEEKLEGVDCGELVVWENRNRHEEGTLRLAVAILRSTAEEPEPDPLVFLSGGPGGRSVYHTASRVERNLWKRLRERRDVVFYDQRGTGYSDPEFCKNMDRVLQTTRFLGLTPEEVEARRVEATRTCREKMLDQGIDFSAYNTETSARDLDDLRQSLGYEQWNLFGISYGTRLALTAMRETPTGIRSVILDSTSPPNARLWVKSPWAFARSLDRVFEQCTADETCRRTFPDPEADFYALLDRLERTPIELTMEDTTRFPDGRLVVDGSLAGTGVFAGLYNRQFIPLVPLLIREAGRESRHVWRALADRLAASPEQASRGLKLSVDCYEAAPFNAPAEIDTAWANYRQLSKAIAYRNLHAECAAWHDERADSSFFQPVRSDRPTMILAGEFDPVTPPAYGRLVAQTLSNSAFVEIPAHGHAVTPHTDCSRDLVRRFLDNPGQPLDTSCVGELPSVSFVTDVHTSPGIYPLARMLQEGPGRPVLAGAGVLAFIFLSGLLGWPLGALVRRFRDRRSLPTTGRQRGARWLAALAAILALGFAVGLVLAIRDAASVNPLLLVFGVSGDFDWVFLLPWVMAGLTAVVVLAAVRAWTEGWWSGWHRIHYGVVAAACVAFLVVVGLLGLM